MKGKRLVAMVLAVVVALGSVCWKPPEAKAVFTEPAVALGCALLTSVIIGTTANLVFTDAVKENIGYAIDGLVTEYLDTVGDVAATTVDNFFSIIASGPKLLTTGAILLSKEAGELIARFVAWLQAEKGLEAGGSSVVVFSDNMFLLQDGTLAYVYSNESSAVSGFKYSVDSDDIIFSTGAKWTFSVSNPGYFYAYDSSGGVSQGFYVGSFIDSGASYFNAYYAHTDGISNPNYYSLTFLFYDEQNSIIGQSSANQLVSYWSNTYGYSSSDISLQPNSELQTIPQEIPDGQSMVISGIDGITLDDQSAAADVIFDAVFAGTLAPTVTVEDVATDIPAIDTDTDTSILSWVKKIWQSVADIPAAIAEAVASIFVPSADFYPTAIASLKDAFSDRMGLLTYPISILFDFLDRMVNLSEQQPILRWGNIYLPGYATPLVAAGQYNLNDAIGTATGKQLHDIYLVIVDAIMILAFVDLCRRKYQKIIEN